MIESARRRALINEITDYKQAFLSFYCEYGRYPGDLNNLGFTGFSSGQTYNSNSFAFPYDETDTKNNHYISDTVSGPFVDMYLAKTMEFEPQGSAESSNPALYSINTKVVPFSKILKDMFLYYELTYDEKKGNDPLYSKHKFDYVQTLVLRYLDIEASKKSTEIPHIMKYIDIKLDDGKYNSGSIRSSCGGKKSFAYNSYDEAVEEKSTCEVNFFKIL